MTNPEQKGKESPFSNFIVEKPLKIINPSKRDPRWLKILVASQMLAGGREIVIKVTDENTYLVSEKTLSDAKDSKLNNLETFLNDVTMIMQGSIEVIVRKATIRFSAN